HGGEGARHARRETAGPHLQAPPRPRADPVPGGAEPRRPGVRRLGRAARHACAVQQAREPRGAGGDPTPDRRNGGEGPMSHDTIGAIAWTLIHFLWQGAAIALITGIAGVFLKRARPSV